jgi:hypothetical protein
MMAVTTFCLASCQREEIMDYALDGKIYFYERTVLGGSSDIKVESKNYSFAVQSDDLTKETLHIKTRLMGNIADRDRMFKAVIVPEGTTAVEGTHFKLLDGVLSAGQYESYLPVEVYRTEDTKNSEVTLVLRLIDTDDLTTGNSDDITFTLNWGDKLLQPANWPYHWGTYSDNKYKFAIRELGVTDWPIYSRYDTEKKDGYYSTSEVVNLASVLNKAYAEYKKEHDPIYIDDANQALGELYYGL